MWKGQENLNWVGGSKARKQWERKREFDSLGRDSRAEACVFLSVQGERASTSYEEKGAETET